MSIWRNCLLPWLALLLPVFGGATAYRSLTPHITEMLYAIGAGSQVVATDQASDYPDIVKTLPKVANYQSLNSESY